MWTVIIVLINNEVPVFLYLFYMCVPALCNRTFAMVTVTPSKLQHKQDT